MSQDDLPVTYLTPCGTCYAFGNAFAQGCRGRAVTSLKLRSGGFAGFVTPDLYPVLREAQNAKRDWYYGDHAYFGRKKYYRVTKNNYQHDALGEATPERFEKLQIKIKPWRTTGSKILLCAQTQTFFNLHGMSQLQWINETTNKLKRFTDRRIKVREKIRSSQPGMTEKNFWLSLDDDVYAVVVHTSAAGVQAALQGIPVFTTAKCAASNFGSMDLSQIERPVRPENREQMAWVLADNQWTLEEIGRGQAWEKLRN